MTRKQRERAARKYDAGLGKRLRHADFNQWQQILDESQHHILKIHGSIA